MTSRGMRYWESGAIPLIAPEILGDIITQVADVGIVINESGSVLSVMVNPQTDGLQRLVQLEGEDLRSVLARESISKFDERLTAFLEGKGSVRPVELNHDEARIPIGFPVRYSFHRIGPDGAILLLGRDLRPIAEMQQQLVKAQIALERDYETQREFDTRFRVLMEATRDAHLFVSLQTGRITEANTAAATALGSDRDDIVNTALTALVEGRRKGELIEALTTQALAERPVAVEARARKGGDPLRLVPTIFRSGGDRMLLLRVETSSEGAAGGDALATNLMGLFQLGPDAIVFTDDAGTILSSNEGFLELIDAAHDLSVKGRSLSDFLQRGSVDLRVLAENAARAGRMRMYATKVVGDYISPRAVEIAATALQGGERTVFAYVLRDTSRAETVRTAASPMTDEGVRSVMELVGSATLKDIVAETTNVVEKMCIETAVELTMNNRVAAAEMLGLSRQSLYVKLRKYGLLSRNEDGED
ncbi:transcriptional regulator PpsR [Histidinibacterium lentulum]|uniref:Transcriptional regulator PpsR n=1 Tax=Histidinibacterium lentulum TaxID=2480588 RepID=A0A3N2R6W9_9RHOB|nr:transcriptional regulator PpsR [Histidinibacterium lentulum]ROU03121.1 transcriptional regulator PpsR [Histidinibacterium lentulum]